MSDAAKEMNNRGSIGSERAFGKIESRLSVEGTGFAAG